MKTMLTLALAATLIATATAQSLLTEPPESPAQKAARQAVLAIQGIRTSNITMLRDAVGRAFPRGVDPQDVVTLWGTHAAAMFALFDGHIAYLQNVLTAAGDTAGLAEVAKIVEQVPSEARRTVHEDGTVTINPAPTPTPTPTPAP